MCCRLVCVHVIGKHGGIWLSSCAWSIQGLRHIICAERVMFGEDSAPWLRVERLDGWEVKGFFILLVDTKTEMTDHLYEISGRHRL